MNNDAKSTFLPPIRKTIKIKFCDFADIFETAQQIRKILSKYYELDETSSPDFLFCGGLGFDHLKYDCVKIAVLSENVAPDFNFYDYAIGFDFIEFGDRYLRMPLFPIHDAYPLLKNRIFEPQKWLVERKFCSFIVSNGSHADPLRIKFFESLSKYKKVDSGGKFMNNIGRRVLNKNEFCKQYKFNIAFENSSHIGYTTEKIMEAYAVQTIPIYYGNPEVGKDFRLDSMVRVADKNDFDRAIDEIIHLDNDDEAYLNMVTQKCLVKDYNYYEDSMNSFLLNILEQNPYSAKRCCRYGGQLIIRRHMTLPLKIENAISKISDTIKNIF